MFRCDIGMSEFCNNLWLVSLAVVIVTLIGYAILVGTITIIERVVRWVKDQKKTK